MTAIIPGVSFLPVSPLNREYPGQTLGVTSACPGIGSAIFLKLMRSIKQNGEALSCKSPKLFFPNHRLMAVSSRWVLLLPLQILRDRVQLPLFPFFSIPLSSLD